MWWLLPAVRKRKSPSESRLFGLLDAVGMVLDQLRTTILTARLRRFALVGSPDDPYYLKDERSADLDAHALDWGLRRLSGESDAALLERIATLPYRHRFLGTKEGMRYLIEELHGLCCDQIVEYYADDQARIILSEENQEAEVETNITHVFGSAEMESFNAYRGTRIYSKEDLTRAFHFWISISNPNGLAYDSDVVRESINAVKPAHTRSIVHFQG
jgi:hypothetical protein